MAVRMQMGDLSIAYTGDGELTDQFADLVSGVDLLIAESYVFDKSVKWHLNYPDVVGRAAKCVVLTHMHGDMLEHVDDVPEECACDGYQITL